MFREKEGYAVIKDGDLQVGAGDSNEREGRFFVYESLEALADAEIFEEGDEIVRVNIVYEVDENGDGVI